jgi:Flp pilus assembly protein TadD
MGQQQQAMAELDSFLNYLDSNGKMSESIPFLEDLVAEHEEQQLFRRTLAAQLHRAGRTQDAIGQLDALGEMLLQNGKNEEAAEVIGQIVAMNPPNAEEYRKLLMQISK